MIEELTEKLNACMAAQCDSTGEYYVPLEIGDIKTALDALGLVVVPRKPLAHALAIVLLKTHEPSDADKRIAAEAFNLISPNSTFRIADGIRAGADLARDYRALIEVLTIR